MNILLRVEHVSFNSFTWMFEFMWAGFIAGGLEPCHWNSRGKLFIFLLLLLLWIRLRACLPIHFFLCLVTHLLPLSWCCTYVEFIVLHIFEQFRILSYIMGFLLTVITVTCILIYAFPSFFCLCLCHLKLHKNLVYVVCLCLQFRQWFWGGGCHWWWWRIVEPVRQKTKDMFKSTVSTMVHCP